VRNARWVTTGLADQVVIATANAANTVLALALLSRTRAGVMLLSVGLAYLAMGINRAFVGEVLLALASRYDGERRDRLVRHGAVTAVTLGIAGGAVMAVVSLLWPRGGDIDLRDLIWVAPFLPMLLLHDTGRYSYLAARRPDRALVIDLTWVFTQGLAVVVMIVAGLTSAGGLFVCWGLGATAGAIVFVARSRIAGPGWRSAGGPLRWFAQTRYLSGWFTATALIGQFSVQLASFLVAAQLSAREVSGFRAAQTALLQPAQNFITAMMGLLVPRASRLAGDAARLPGAKGAEAAAALRRQTVRLALAFAGLALLMIAIVVPIARTVLVHIPKFADIAPLALPTAIQAGLFLVQLPFTSAMRGMHRAPMLFLQYALFTTSSMSGLVIGAHLDGLTGAVWGLASGAGVGLVVMIGLYAYALRWLGNADAERFAQDDVVSTSP
jgi:hypothetical protein